MRRKDLAYAVKGYILRRLNARFGVDGICYIKYSANDVANAFHTQNQCKNARNVRKPARNPDT